MKSKREKELEVIIIGLVHKLKLYQKEYGLEYIGGKHFQFIINEIKELGIDL